MNYNEPLQYKIKNIVGQDFKWIPRNKNLWEINFDETYTLSIFFVSVEALHVVLGLNRSESYVVVFVRGLN